MRTEEFSNGPAMSLVDRTNSWRNRRSRLEKWLLTSSSLPLFLCLALVFATMPFSSAQSIQRTSSIGFINSYKAMLNLRQQRSADNSSVCLTPGCILIASHYLQRANLSADPCKDFYNFACGKYEADNTVPDQVTSFTSASSDLNYRLKNILDNPPDGKENNAFGNVRAYYQACKDKTEINNLKEKPLTDILEQLGGWPVVEGESWTSATGEKFEWTDTIYALRNMGVSHSILADLSVVLDTQDSSRYIIEMAPPFFGTSATYLVKGFKDNIVQSYLKYMVNIAVLLGSNRDKAEEEMTDVLEFEIVLAKYTLTTEDQRNFTQINHRMTLDELQQLAPVVNWVEFANRLLLDTVDEKEVVNVILPTYFVKLTDLLKDTPKRTVANYVMWRVASNLLGMLDDRFRNNFINYYSSFTTVTSDDPRWLICLTATKTFFRHAIGSMYVRQYFDRNARDRAISLVHNIRESFLSMLKNVDWMDAITLNKALNKAKAMEEMIAYPLELLNDTALEDYYSHVTVKENKFFDSTLLISKVWLDDHYGNLRKVNNRTDWRNKRSVVEVNAFYNRAQNLIQIPAGILQGVFFGGDRPRYINYGAIGSVIGHEITHGFDDQGRQYDDKGNLKSWWEPATDVTFKDKVKCIINQYSHYNVTSINMTVNGIKTQGENIADNGGAKASYRAYKKWASENEEEKPLPGLSFTSQQMFWISLANVYCTKTTPAMVKRLVLTDEHSPAMFRVNGVVSNSMDFSTDFQCPVGSPMNPVNKCQVW